MVVVATPSDADAYVSELDFYTTVGTSDTVTIDISGCVNLLICVNFFLALILGVLCCLIFSQFFRR